MSISRKDLFFIALMGAVLLVFIFISGKETTKKVPLDPTHRPFYDLLKKTGSKMETEKGCGECHNGKGVPFPKNHPAKNRCLLCHKMEQTVK